MTAEIHPFDQAIALERLNDNDFRGHTHPDYWNLVGPFGGITAATALNALLLRPDRQGDPLSLTVNYAGPVQAGSFAARTRLMRNNRSTQHWSVDLVQGAKDECVINAIAVFAVRRPTWGTLEAPRPNPPTWRTLQRNLVRTPVVWPHRYDMRHVRGEMRIGEPIPEAGRLPEATTEYWISDHPPRPLDFASLTSICDAFFPRIYIKRARPVPIGTVSLNVHFHVGADALAGHGSDPVFGIAQAQVFHEGFFDQVGQIWSEAGHLLATTQQMVWYKE